MLATSTAMSIFYSNRVIKDEGPGERGWSGWKVAGSMFLLHTIWLHIFTMLANSAVYRIGSSACARLRADVHAHARISHVRLDLCSTRYSCKSFLGRPT